MNTIKIICGIWLAALLICCESIPGKELPQSTHPVWSPDGTKIAFGSSKLDPGEIFIYDHESKVEKQIKNYEE
jgi:hypothetical protein